MSTHGLTVRCLASTSAGEVQRLNGSVEDVEDTRHEQGTNEQGEESDLIDGLEKDGSITSARGEDGNSHEQAASPTMSGSSEDSDSNSDNDSDSDFSTASSDLPKPNASTASMSCINEAQLSPDGTCIFTTDYSRAFSVYPISTDILESTTTQPLNVYARVRSSDPIWAFASNPLFNLQDSSTTHVLVSRRDRYITLHNALWDVSSTGDTSTSPVDINTPLASYKLINHLTEAVTAPLSLAYSPCGTHFFAGSQNSIDLFDLTYTENPVHTILTIPSRRNKLKGGGRGFKGTISALSVSPTTDGLLAAGARTRSIGLYDTAGGSEVTHFFLPGTIDGKKLRSEADAHLIGDGVSSLKWSPCGTYLYIAERDSDALFIYDARNYSLALGYCAGRKAFSKQKFGFDIWSAGPGVHEVWAGGMDGKIRVWRDPWTKEGAVEADEVVDVGAAGTEMPIVSTLVHASGSLAVAARGSLRVGSAGGEKGAVARGGGGIQPRLYESGCLDILGLSG
jgi:hypothetical protein